MSLRPRITPLGDGLTVISGVPGRPDLKKDHDFKVGDKVRLRARPDVTGVVQRVPEGPVVQLGPHTLGNEMSVALDIGGVAVSDVDEFEHADPERAAAAVRAEVLRKLKKDRP